MPGDHIWLGRCCASPSGPLASHVRSFWRWWPRRQHGVISSPCLIVPHPCIPSRLEGCGKWEREAVFPRLLPALAVSPPAWPGLSLESQVWTELGGELVLGTQLREAPGLAGGRQEMVLPGRRGPRWGRAEQED